MCLTIRHCGLSPCNLQLTVLHIRVICIYKGNFMNVPIGVYQAPSAQDFGNEGTEKVIAVLQTGAYDVRWYAIASVCMLTARVYFLKPCKHLCKNHHPRNIVTYLMWVRRQLWSDIEFLNYILISLYKKCSHTLMYHACNHNAFPPILVLARTDVLLKRISSPTVGPICTEFTHDNKMCSACSFVQKQISSS